MMGSPLAHVPALALMLVMAASSGVQAQSDPIEDRQEAMGDLSEAHKTASAMVKGHVPYDAQAAATAMNAIATEAPKLPAMFPPGSQTGEDTRAAPAIWEHFDDFEAHISKLQAAAIAAATAAPQGLAAFTPAYEVVAGACKTCHSAYRLAQPGAPDPLATP